jgi:hypothetical protein
MKPTEHVWVAAEFGDLTELWKGGMKIAQKPASHAPVLSDCTGTQSQGESLEMSFENLIE